MYNNKWAPIFMILNGVLAQFAIMLGEGKVPLPEEVKWAVPLLVALITGLSPYLKLWGKNE